MELVDIISLSIVATINLVLIIMYACHVVMLKNARRKLEENNWCILDERSSTTDNNLTNKIKNLKKELINDKKMLTFSLSYTILVSLMIFFK